jgi:hypothetical protein
MQKESSLFFSFPSESNFGEAKVTNKRIKIQGNNFANRPNVGQKV